MPEMIEGRCHVAISAFIGLIINDNAARLSLWTPLVDITLLSIPLLDFKKGKE